MLCYQVTGIVLCNHNKSLDSCYITNPYVVTVSSGILSGNDIASNTIDKNKNPFC